MTSLAEVEASTKEFLTAADVAPVMRSDPHAIRIAAHERPELLGFPVIVIGSRVRIPRQGFLAYCYGRTGRSAE